LSAGFGSCAVVAGAGGFAGPGSCASNGKAIKYKMGRATEKALFRGQFMFIGPNFPMLL
jgi:hypothetical protein